MEAEPSRVQPGAGRRGPRVKTERPQRALLGRVDFLDVADSKPCSQQATGHIAGRDGRFVTVMPRSRKEGDAFRNWLQTHTPVWTEAARRRAPRLGQPDEVWRAGPI